MTVKKINNLKNSALNEDNHEIIKLIKERYTATQLIKKGNNRRSINRWQCKIKHRYKE